MAPPEPSYPQGLAHSLTTGERRRARRSEEEKRAAVRLTLGAWIQAHGRLPLSADFRVGTSWNLETPLGRMGHHQVYRLYGSLDALWQDCYEQGLCTRRQWQAAREHKGKAIRTNGAKGRAAQRQKVSTS